VTTAVEMHNEVMKSYGDFDHYSYGGGCCGLQMCIGCRKKNKKSGEKLTLELVKNPDIAAELGKVKGSRIFSGI